VIYVIVALIVLYILQMLIAQFLPLPPPVMMLIRVLVGLLVLLAALNCFGLFPGDAGGPYPFYRR
jgi:hypothetical protein